MGSGGKHIRKHIQVRSVVTLNGVWGQAHPKTYTRAQNSESLMSATFDVVKNVKGKCENDSVEVCSRKLIAVPL